VGSTGSDADVDTDFAAASEQCEISRTGRACGKLSGGCLTRLMAELVLSVGSKTISRAASLAKGTRVRGCQRQEFSLGSGNNGQNGG
jgi:hypothetical protein